MSKEIFVNEIIEEENGSITGLTVWDETILEDIKIIFDERTQKGIKHLIKNPPHPEGFHLFTRFYQYIVLFQYYTLTGISIKLSDYQNNLDNALDEYLKLDEKGWAAEDRNTIMEIFEEIRQDKSNEKAEMVIKHHIPADRSGA